MNKKLSALVIISALIIILVGFNQIYEPQRSVVIYTSVDQIYSEPILKDFEKRTGIKVRAVYDVEATKTTGLVNRLIAEASRPQADVFWNGEFVQTMLLKEEGILTPYKSANAQDIPKQYVDPEGYWTCLGGRARVLLINTDLVPPADYPKSIFDLVSSKWSGEDIGISYPLFGTSTTHAAALYAGLGPDHAMDFYTQLKSRGVRVVDGNSVVRDLVANGQLKVGLTDTDDACGALRNGSPVVIILPDQEKTGIGTLIIPNTVALIADSPHPIEGRMLIDFLLSNEVETELIKSGWIQVPIRQVEMQPACPPNMPPQVKGMNVTFTDIYYWLEPVKKELSDVFIR
jgi:iron(III) transport system substrate-binding protein